VNEKIYTNSCASDVSYESILAAAHKIAARKPGKVFVWDGDLASFRAECAKQGIDVTDREPGKAEATWPASWQSVGATFLPPYAMEVWDRDGKLWIGDRRDLKALFPDDSVGFRMDLPTICPLLKS
jgi:hypothetical protein